MSILSEIFDHNRKFVASREYEKFSTDQYPNKRILVVTCMDTRLVELLPAAMNLRQGDVKVLKTAGAIVAHPFGGIMRSILVAVYQLDVQEIAVVGHHGCGMTGMNCDTILSAARKRGIDESVIQSLQYAGIDLERWLRGFATPADGVRQSVKTIRTHPLLPKNLPVHGLLISPETGALEKVEE
jgi:carbonic anhydrase